ncbi:microtubule-associated serine/threonine-protein kinase 2-like protein [Lates japonicus]|uniref:Microtubule-associated serine/threonine-protein kinase 2-like protein n=1 Tax=Lates japonicus TaxID=270547 RepID=A0AAD3NLN3_LATJO|nr:microtubule-associated serine/threonine-protein kinase 2-like protein [Lates japonicus]
MSKEECSMESWKEFAAPPPLLFRKLSNPDLSPAATAATKSKLHRQLSQDESRARRSSMAMTGKQLLPLSSSLHAGVSQLAWQGPSGAFGGPGAVGGASAGGGEVNNLVRMRSQTLGQSAPSLTGLGREEATRVTGLTSPLTSHSSADKRFDNSSGASCDEMGNIMQKEG